MTTTSGEYTTEAESAEAFDRIHATHLALYFSMHVEVKGTLTQPRPGQIDKSVRIDRVLVPRRTAIDIGWTHGAIGVELKRSGEKIGPPLAQAMDYTRCVWSVGGVLINLGAVFLWPCAEQYGPLASLMSNNRVGSASTSHWSPLVLHLGHETVLRVDAAGLTVRDDHSGRKVGSR